MGASEAESTILSARNHDWSTLDRRILLKIFSRLDIASLQATQLTCRRFCLIVDNINIWRDSAIRIHRWPPGLVHGFRSVREYAWAQQNRDHFFSQAKGSVCIFSESSPEIKAMVTSTAKVAGLTICSDKDVPEGAALVVLIDKSFDVARFVMQHEQTRRHLLILLLEHGVDEPEFAKVTEKWTCVGCFNAQHVRQGSSLWVDALLRPRPLPDQYPQIVPPAQLLAKKQQRLQHPPTRTPPSRFAFMHATPTRVALVSLFVLWLAVFLTRERIASQTTSSSYQPR